MRLVSLTFCGNMVGSVIFILLGIFDDFWEIFPAVFQFYNALFGRFSGFGFYSNLMLQIGERTNFIIALCSNLQILDGCPLLESGTALEFFIRSINEPAGRVVFFRYNSFSLPFYFDAFPDTFLCVFLIKRFRTATDKTFFIQRTERDVFGGTFFKRFPFDFILWLSLKVRNLRMWKLTWCKNWCPF